MEDVYYFKYNEHHKRRHYANVWCLILDLKKEIEAGNTLYFYRSIKHGFCRWKNKTTGINYQISEHSIYVADQDIPNILLDDLSLYIFPQELVKSIKENLKKINSVINLKAFL